MPQPLSSVIRKHPNAKVSLFPGNLYKQPALASSVCGVIATSSSIDLELSLLPVHILGAEARAALAIYDALLTDKLKMQALEAAAKATLTTTQHRVFTTVITIINSVQKDRHRLAHWIWASTDTLPNAILLADPKHLRWREIELGRPVKLPETANALAYDWKEHYEKRNKALALNYSRIFVYTVADLHRAQRDFIEAHDALFYFRYYLQPIKWNRLAGPTPTYLKGLNTSAGALRRLKTLRLFREAHRPSKSSKKRRRSKPRK